jgi:hypothetical protein
MLYVDYRFTIDADGLKLSDKGSPDKWDQVDINRTPLNVGDMFVLTLDQDNCMYFRKFDNPILDELIEGGLPTNEKQLELF